MRDESVGYYCLLHVRMLGVESAMLVLLPRMVVFTAFFLTLISWPGNKG